MAFSHDDVAGLLRMHGYDVVEKIGQGSFGKALLVQGNGGGARLLCKLVDVSLASPEERTDAVKEAQLLATLIHPYVVRYNDSFLESGWLSILMEYCGGGDLNMEIDLAKKEDTPIPERQVLRWMTQAIFALKYVHDKGVLHRDLKPANFFLSKAKFIKMGDFGIAKVLSSTASCARTVVGTPYYMSPEIFQDEPYARPADVWAMGCIFYELCERKVPFDARTPYALMPKICNGPTPSIGPGYSDLCRNLCSEMLYKDPARRPSAEAILQLPRIVEVLNLLIDEGQAAQEALLGVAVAPAAVAAAAAADAMAALAAPVAPPAVAAAAAADAMAALASPVAPAAVAAVAAPDAMAALAAPVAPPAVAAAAAADAMAIFLNHLSPEYRAMATSQGPERLYLERMGIDSRGAAALAEALKVNKSLVCIDLDNNTIGRQGAGCLAEALVVNNTLKKIRLRDNQIGPAGAGCLAQALVVNNTLKEIFLGGNQIGPAGAAALALALKVNESLVRIDLDNNTIGETGAGYLAEALVVNSTLKEIWLCGNQFGTAGREALEGAKKPGLKIEM